MSHKRVLKETGEWNATEGAGWMKSLREHIRQIQFEVPDFKFVSIRGFDMYQGPVATVSYKGKNYKVWMQDEGILWIEDFPADNTSGPGNNAGFQGTVHDIIDALDTGVQEESRMTFKLLEAIRAKDYHTANELFEFAMRDKMVAKVNDIKTRVYMEDASRCELCGSTQNVTMVDGTPLCAACDPESDLDECDKMVKEAYQPKTGQACSCKPGLERDNCPQCEGTGQRIDFAAIRAKNSGGKKIAEADITEAHQAWKVTLNGKNIDTVFYDDDCDADYVKRGLVNHDGYDPNITVSKDNKYNVRGDGSSPDQD